MAGKKRKITDTTVGHLEQAALHPFLQGCPGGWWSASSSWASPPAAKRVAGWLCFPRHPCWPCGYWGIPGDPMGCNPLRLTVWSPWYVIASGDHGGMGPPFRDIYHDPVAYDPLSGYWSPHGIWGVCLIKVNNMNFQFWPRAESLWKSPFFVVFQQLLKCRKWLYPQSK